MNREYLVASGLLVDIVGFILIFRYGHSLSLWAGSIDDLTGTTGAPEERKE